MVNKIELNEVVEGKVKNKINLFWKKQIENSKSNHKWWLREVEKYYNIYYNTGNNYGYNNGFAYSYNSYNLKFSNTYNLFYSNIETKRPLLFSKLPELDIRRRNDTKDRVSRIASEMLERGCNFFMENYGDEIGFKKAILDREITGRGIVRQIFESGLEEFEGINEEGGKEVLQEVNFNLKKIKTKFVPYDMFLMEPAKEWEDVGWISFTHQMSKAEVTERFGKAKADNIKYTETSLDTPPDNDENQKNDEGELKVLAMRTVVYEIWNKDDKKIYFYSPQEEKLLGTAEDNYNLQNFFPIPRPLGLLSNNRSLIPVPPLRHYLSKYEELQDVDQRLRGLVKQATVCYAVSSSLPAKDVNAILNQTDGVATSIKTIDPKGDLSKQIYPKDLIPIINAITVLTARQQQIIQDIREITGLSDIVRGITEAQETATAQKIKGDFAVSRLQLDQQEIEYFVRDVLRIKCELIAENYSAEELAKISGLNVIDVEAIMLQIDQKAQQLKQQILLEDLDPQQIEKLLAQLEQQVQQEKQQAQQQINKQLKTTFSCTKRELAEINAIIKNDKLRDFNIDIETESTVKIDNDIEKAQRIELTTSIANTLNALAPLIQAGQLTDDAVRELLGFIVRPFKVGRNLEEAILEKQDTSERDKQQQALQQAQMQIQMEKEVLQPNRELDIKQQEVDDKRTIEQAKIESNELKTEVESDTDIAVAEISAENRKKSNNKKEKNET